MPVEEQPKLARCRRGRFGHRLEPAKRGQLGSKPGRGNAVQIPHQPVVRQNVSWSQERAPRGTSCTPRRPGVPGWPARAFLPRAPCAGRAMVAVGHIGVRIPAKASDPRRGVGHPPDAMPTPSGRGEVVEPGRFAAPPRASRSSSRPAAIGQKHRLAWAFNVSTCRVRSSSLSCRVFSCLRMTSRS